ncbi:hypothetical protein Bca101_086595 [Brassica carinata]
MYKKKWLLGSIYSSDEKNSVIHGFIPAAHITHYCRRWITPLHKAHRITGPNPASWISLVGSAAKRFGSTLECF